jgi:hypothetical protein
MTGSVPQSAAVHVLVLVSYALASCYVALALARRRLLK